MTPRKRPTGKAKAGEAPAGGFTEEQLAAFGMTPEQFAMLQAQGVGSFDPFASDVGEGVIWTGYDERDFNMKTRVDRFGDKSVKVTVPKGYQVKTGVRNRDNHVIVTISKDGKTVETKDLGPLDEVSAPSGDRLGTGKGDDPLLADKAYTYQDPRQGEKIDKNKTIAEELQRLYTLPPDRVAFFKTQLWMAGYFGEDTKLDDVDLYSLDQDTFSALGTIMLEAARYYAAGRKVTWQQLLSQKATGRDQQGEEDDVTKITLSDPAQLTVDAEQAAYRILGRKPSPADIQMYIQGVHSAEAKRDTLMSTNQDATAINVNSAARAESFWREKYPGEAFAVEYADRAQQFMSLLETPVGSQPAEVEV